MARWNIDFLDKTRSHFATVEAPDEKTATAEVAKLFHITPARRFKLTDKDR
jgi:hypothetical protein